MCPLSGLFLGRITKVWGMSSPCLQAHVTNQHENAIVGVVHDFSAWEGGGGGVGNRYFFVWGRMQASWNHGAADVLVHVVDVGVFLLYRARTNLVAVPIPRQSRYACNFASTPEWIQPSLALAVPLWPLYNTM